MEDLRRVPECNQCFIPGKQTSLHGRIGQMERSPEEMAVLMEGQVQDEFVDYTVPMLREKLKVSSDNRRGERHIDIRWRSQ